MSKITLSQIKAKNKQCLGGHFFDRDTMKFFGDTMKSFKVIEREEKIYLERITPIFSGGVRIVSSVGKLYEFNPETGAIRSAR